MKNGFHELKHQDGVCSGNHDHVHCSPRCFLARAQRSEEIKETKNSEAMPTRNHGRTLLVLGRGVSPAESTSPTALPC